MCLRQGENVCARSKLDACASGILNGVWLNAKAVSTQTAKCHTTSYSPLWLPRRRLLTNRPRIPCQLVCLYTHLWEESGAEGSRTGAVRELPGRAPRDRDRTSAVRSGLALCGRGPDERIAAMRRTSNRREEAAIAPCMRGPD